MSHTIGCQNVFGGKHHYAAGGGGHYAEEGGGDKISEQVHEYEIYYPVAPKQKAYKIAFIEYRTMGC